MTDRTLGKYEYCTFQEYLQTKPPFPSKADIAVYDKEWHDRTRYIMNMTDKFKRIQMADKWDKKQRAYQNYLDLCCDALGNPKQN